MHSYVITDRATGERTSLIAPNRDAALKAYVKRRLTVERVTASIDEVNSSQPFELPGEHGAAASKPAG